MATNEFRALDKESLMEYIKATPSLSFRLGNKLDDMHIEMAEDGFINCVYFVKSSGGSLVIKQALPYVRSKGKSWPLSRKRSEFEGKALQVYGSLCPSHIPQVYHLDASLSLIAMRYLEPPHISLKKGLIAGIQYPLLADHMSEYFANVIYGTSLLCMTNSKHERAVAEFCGNLEVSKRMAHHVFLDVFDVSRGTTWTSPHLDADVKAVQEDNTIKLEVTQLKSMFCERAQALIHSDLQASAVMVTQDSTQVIDPEFAFYGPMGYDMGTFLRDFIASFFLHDGLATTDNDRQNYKLWLVKTIEDIWNLFQQKFIKHWNENERSSGEVCNDPKPRELRQRKYMEDLFQDSLGFCGASLMWAIIRLGHLTQDFKLIDNVSKRADCERKALSFAKIMLKERRKFTSIATVVLALQQLN